MTRKLSKSLLTALIAMGSATIIPTPLNFPALTPSEVLAQTTNAGQTQADILLQQGIQEARIGQFRAAIQSWESALTIYREIGHKQGEAYSLGNLGIAYGALGQYTKAIAFHQQSLAIASEIGDRQWEVGSLGNLGDAYGAQGEYTLAIAFHQQELTIAREIGDILAVAKSLNSLGNAYGAQGEYTKAIEYYQQYLAIAKQIGYTRGVAISLGNLGIAYRSLGQYTQAIAYHQQSLAIDREIGDRLGVAASLGSLGNTYRSLGQYTQAIEYYQQSLALGREIGHQLVVAKSLGNLGSAYNSLGEYTIAIKYHQQSLALGREIGDRLGVANSLANLGSAYSSLAQYTKAMEYYQQSLALAREIGDRQGEANSLTALGSAYYSLGENQKAIALHQESLAIAREIGNRVGVAISLNNIGLTYNNLKQYADASTVLLDAIEVWESLRPGLTDAHKISIFDTQAASYHLLQLALVAQNKSDRALEIAERARARALVELLGSRLSKNSNNETKETTNAISTKSPTIQDIQQIAKQQNATLVEYSIVEDNLYIWVVKPTGEIAFKQVDLSSLDTSLEDLVNISRQSIGVRASRSVIVSVDEQNQDQNLEKLHEILIHPIANLLPSNPNDRVIFIPQQSLFLVPFPALKDTSGNYLIDKHTILTAPAIQVLQLTDKQQQKATGTQPLIVGNPIMPEVGIPPEQLAPLPGAEEEAKAIAQILKTQAITGKDATKAAILAQLPDAGIIHFATHGLLEDFGEGVPGAIALTPDPPQPPLTKGGLNQNGNNGLLTAGEIFDLNLKAQLVVLSACDTGRGDLTGDGVIGLSRSLIAAGVPSVIVSLWSVPDAPTADLMKEFYAQLEKTPDKAQALRQAMLDTKAKHPNPIDWAAFTIIGEAE